MRRLLVIASLLGLSGCTIEVPEGRYVCDLADPRCPPGMVCVDGLCMRGDGGDGGVDDGGDGAANDAGGILCPPLMAPLDGWVDTPDRRPGGIATYGCDHDRGYALIGNGGSSHRVCQADGTWDGSAPACLKATCSVPPAVARASVDRTVRAAPGETVTYVCDRDPAYAELVGDATLTCGQDFEWQGEVPACRKSACEPPPSIANATVDHEGVASPGETATYTCELGYQAQGSVTITCDEEFDWIGTLPTCVWVGCGPVETPMHGQVVYPDSSEEGDRALHTCDSHRHFTARARVCVNGTWDEEPVVCEPTNGFAAWPIPGTDAHPFDYVDRGDYILDRVTELEWQKAPSPTAMTWEEAFDHCASLELGGDLRWRLPTRVELLSIVNFGASPPIRNDVFEHVGAQFWTSSPVQSAFDADGTLAYTVDFGSNGRPRRDQARTSTHRVRCVR